MARRPTLGQRFTARDAAVIADAQRRRKGILTVGGDGDWLRAYGREPKKLLSEMADRGALHALGAGRYVIAPTGRTLLEQAAPWQVVLDGTVSPYGDYYLGFFSAIVEHHLTDLDSPTIYVAFNRKSNIDRHLSVSGRDVVPTYTSSPRKWFGVEKVRVSRSERYYRSDIERTLLDCLDRPRLCGSTEVWIRAWERALRQELVDVQKLCAYAKQLGPVIGRRAGFMLSVGGHAAEAQEHLSELLNPGGSVALDLSAPTGGRYERDTKWGVSLNVSREFIEGMFAYGK